ncbi:unnamed protein product [Leptidea sinapis]|uniref:Uncharacterized protein n=1 Tax=Leptidea sinapis TaxID=189913 RepID=A0A5E4QLX4_9NEOP|nr:unnamed protein product [Leptidea sinapis]
MAKGMRRCIEEQRSGGEAGCGEGGGGGGRPPARRSPRGPIAKFNAKVMRERVRLRGTRRNAGAAGISAGHFHAPRLTHSAYSNKLNPSFGYR